MKDWIRRATDVFPGSKLFHISMFVFRIAVSIQLMMAHGLKKISIGVDVAEVVPNPLHLPQTLNRGFAVASNLVFPLFVILCFFTRIAALAILAVTLIGYFVVHWHDGPLERDMPFIYSMAFLLIFFIGPGKYAIDCWLNKILIKNHQL